MIKFSSKELGKLGVIVSAVGTLISALSFAESHGNETGQLTGMKYSIPLVNDYGFKIGLTIVISGFILQYWEKTKENGIGVRELGMLLFWSLIIYMASLTFQYLIFL